MNESRTRLGPIPDEWFENDFYRDPKKPPSYPEDFIKELDEKIKKSVQRAAELIKEERKK